MGIVLILILGAAVLVAAFAVTLYNGLVAARNALSNTFSGIDVQLQRRHDLIPNLVASAKGYMEHEQETLTRVTAARAEAAQAQARAKSDPSDSAALAALAGAETALGGALGRLFALVESYPDLKASQNLILLQEELSRTEDQIATARRQFNEAVLDYNTRLQAFPANLIAGNFGFTTASTWEMDDPSARAAPRIEF